MRFLELGFSGFSRCVFDLNEVFRVHLSKVYCMNRHEAGKEPSLRQGIMWHVGCLYTTKSENVANKTNSSPSSVTVA